MKPPVVSTNTFSTKPIDQLQGATNSLLNWLMQPKSQVLDTEPDFVFDMFRQQLTSAYEIYPKTSQTAIHLNLEPWIVPENPALQHLQELFQHNAELFQIAMIHGSAATGEIVPNWSDVDLLVILAPAVLQDTALLKQARTVIREAEYVIKQFDPHQHHGVQCISSVDLQYYPESFLPVATWQQGRSLLGASTVILHVRDSKAEQRGYLEGIARTMGEAAKTGILRHHARNDVYLEDNFKNATDNWYQLKYFLSVILLTPSLYIGLVDQPIYKKDSFNKITQYYSENELTLVRTCEKVRSGMLHISLVDNQIPVEVQTILGPEYFKRANEWLQLLLERL